jgi:predicted ArsR family transcriptional regulator
MSRKPHVHVDQEEYVTVLDEVGGAARLDDIAEHFDVSEATARRKLDGLVAQRRVKLLRERPREYGLTARRA